MTPPTIHRLQATLLLVLALWAGVAAASAGSADLAERRAARRALVRTAADQAAKAGVGAPFSLLVIPVEFTDARAPDGFDPGRALGPRLTGDGASLRRYFATASGGACDVQVTLAPLVSLAGARRDYADLPQTGYMRTRQMATEALVAFRDLGLPFRLLDNDGPDRVPGTADDDGLVDGVLILHAGIGLENDLQNGLIAPLQFFLEDPVLQDGIAAVDYAVAAMGSGLGIWAHETAHLLGLEERYDPTLVVSGASEVHSRGGLGRFSLMAAGAWGSGGGREPALLDAYSRVQLGWSDVQEIPGGGYDARLVAAVDGGSVLKVWGAGPAGDEYFLLETRRPADGFDTAVPAGHLVVLHVDTVLPETGVAADGHLRVRLVEADGDTDLADGVDEGSLADLFPGATGAAAWNAGTTPSSDGYRGPSGVSLAGITAAADGSVTLHAATAATPVFAIDLAFGSGPEPELDLVLTSLGLPVTTLEAAVEAGYPSYGSFVGGGLARTLTLTAIDGGRWVPQDAVAWETDPDAPPGASTRFIVTPRSGAWEGAPAVRAWAWSDDGAALAFDGAWPGAWTIDHPEGNTATTWHRWDDRCPAVPTEGAYVLACAADQDSVGDTWPDVAGDLNAHAVLTSGPLPAGLTGLRLVHFYDTEPLRPGVFMDGCTAEWLGPDGVLQPAVPVDGWPGVVDGQSLAALHGRDAWGGRGQVLPDGRPAWRTDVLPLPEDGPGPWRLRLVFATNTRGWDYRGWLIAGIEPLTGDLPVSASPIAWTADGLTWSWPVAPDTDGAFAVQEVADGAWREVLEGSWPAAGTGSERFLDAATLLAALPEGSRRRSTVRIVGPLGDGTEAVLASGTVVVFPDGGGEAPATMSRPWPNPATDGTRCLVSVTMGATARLTAFDLAGRMVRSWSLPGGDHLVHWDGNDDAGRRVAAGTYVLRLEGSDGTLTHKVVLLH